MSMPARKYDTRPQQDDDAALELMTTSDFYDSSDTRPARPLRDRRQGADHGRSGSAGRAQPRI